jgi:pimeloyl-ACP methyl ester carboxylesterase
MILSTTLKKRLIKVAGSSLRVVESGQGPVVVLAHGYLWSAEMWRPQIEALSRHYRVIVPDLWGHGGSDQLPKGTQDLRDLARHHLELFDRLGVADFSLVGHSLGGMWGAELALAVPDRVRAVVLIDSDLKTEPLMKRNRYVAMLDAIQATHSFPAAIMRDVVGLFFSPDVSASAPKLIPEFGSRLALWDTDRLLDSVIPIGHMTFERRETLAEFSRLSMPKLVIHGTDDTPRPIDEARRMSEALACQLVEIAGAGHMTPVEKPAEVTWHLLDFLGKLHGAQEQHRLVSGQRVGAGVK